ncbi:MAG: TraR/DksA C4-type zinc finger protein [Patescibacteria group bacterium]|nr:TraR/DksA C4-type zinc finger protein [Patescibacteria group bacterium]
MDEKKLSHFKKKLEEELRTVESDLADVGRKNPDAPGEWEAQVKDTDTASTEADEKADKFEEYESNSAILEPVAARAKEIQHALEKIASGTYGLCEVSGERIEEARLEANPAARTCEKHMRQGKS